MILISSIPICLDTAGNWQLGKTLKSQNNETLPLFNALCYLAVRIIAPFRGIFCHILSREKKHAFLFFLAQIEEA